MNTISSFIFFDETSTETMSNPMINANRGEELVLSVTGTGIDIVMYGVADVEADEKFPMTCLNKGNYDMVEEITEAGIYMIAAEGINRFYCENKGVAGTVKVYGKLMA